MNEGKNELRVGQQQVLSQCDQAVARQSARGVLNQRIDRLRAEANQLEALAMALPLELPRDADQAMWNLLIGR